MQGTGKWIGGGIIGLIGILGLFLSAHAHGGAAYYVGIAVFVAAVLAIGAMIKHQFDLAEGTRH
jgi:hypothetical protein